MVFVDVLGAFRVVVNGEQAVLRGPMQGAVLARLVVAGGEVVSADRFIDELWAGEPPPKAGAALQAHISHLRRALEPDRPRRAPARVLISQPPGYALARDAATVDAWRFEELLRHADTATDPAIRLRILDTALSLWRGDAYAPYVDTAWSAPEITRLTELRWTALELRAATALHLNRPAEVAAALHRHVESHPEREESVRLLALAQYRQGRQLAALETLRRVRAHLNTEFGIDPGPPLRTLESAILAHAPELDHTPPALAPPIAVQPPPSGAAFSELNAETDSAATEPAATIPAVPAEVAVGYAAERAGLLAAAEEARTGRSRVVWIDGEAGAGKTTLVSSAASALAAAGWTVVAGHCPEVDGAPAAWAWIELAEGLADRRTRPGAPVTDAGFARLEGDFGTSAVIADVSVESARDLADFDVSATPFELARSFVERCRGRVAGGPVAVLLEDAHRADSATLQVLRQVVAWLAGEPVLFVVTSRGSEAGNELQATAAALAGVTASRFELSGLDAEAVRAVMAAAGMPVIDGATLALVRDRTGGNPMFVRELAKLAAAEGDLLAVPVGVREVLRRRIARLPADAARMLRFMAVWGDEVGFDDLLELAEENEDTLVDLVDTAVVAGLLRIGRAGRIRFGHALTRDAVYDEIPALRRGRMHWTALRVAERGPHRDLDALAHHAIAGATGSTAEQALRHVVAAARQCVARGAHSDAVPLWRAAVDLHVLAGHIADHGDAAASTDRARPHDMMVDRAVGSDVLEAMCSLTTALGYGGNDTSARAVRLRALDLAHVLAVPRGMPEESEKRTTATGFAAPADGETGAGGLSPGHRDRASAGADSVVDGVLGAVSAASDPVAYVLSSWRAPVIWGTRDKRLPDTRIVEALAAALARPLPAATRVRLLVATVFEVEGNDDPRAFAAAAEALATARTLDDPELLCAALNARAFLALGPDLWDEREPLASELLTVSTAAGFVEYQAVAHFLQCLIACGASDLVGARAAVERGLECASGGQLRQLLAVLSLFSAVLAALRGDLATAEAIYARCSADLVASGTANGAELMIAARMMLGWARGDLSQLAEPMGAVHAVAPDALVFAYVVALLDAGEIDCARTVFRAAGPTQRDHYWSVMAVFRARGAVRLGEMDAVRECYADMAPRSGTMAGLDTGSVVYGPLDAVLAELADALGEHVAAERYRESAAAVSAHIRAQLAELDA
ncbi:AAA family ATPase [Nocardia sp. 2]|uniref:AAA family ATPase n=1 Tax=Nocardia acididurans TaxID=2802282 RepID=A0ABS1M7C0_9NOCA|nr:BTAD domain-containing putative transcriptional regulator [Nocardia acididurans]MBL1075053.1 AAA family ATPase [Nocardia acididurans]